MITLPGQKWFLFYIWSHLLCSQNVSCREELKGHVRYVMCIVSNMPTDEFPQGKSHCMPVSCSQNFWLNWDTSYLFLFFSIYAHETSKFGCFFLFFSYYDRTSFHGKSWQNDSHLEPLGSCWPDRSPCKLRNYLTLVSSNTYRTF